MATSGGILAFLDLLDEVGTDLGYISDFVHNTARDDLINFRFLSAAEVKAAQNIRTAVSKTVQARQELSRELSDEVIRILVGILGDGTLDECFTRLELQMIPEILRRWKDLQAIQVVLLPTKKEVADYFRQATTCYLHGLPTAAAILCRAVLQFALEEAIPNGWGCAPWGDRLLRLADETDQARQQYEDPPCRTGDHCPSNPGNRKRCGSFRGVHRGPCAGDDQGHLGGAGPHLWDAQEGPVIARL